MTADINWEAIKLEATQILQELLRIDTTNPPGNEILAVEYIAGRLREVGIESLVFESKPGRGNLVARWSGTGEDAPLLLMGHVDVVPAEPSQWSRPPFSGDLHDGYIWGRGALDMKCTVVAHLVVMRMLARLGLRLRRDIIFMANADEEVGGKLGAGWMVDHHPDLIRAEYALNEGGGGASPIGGAMFYTVQTAEKGVARFRMTGHGQPGHGSVPRDDNAVVRLSAAVARLGATPLPLHVTRTVEGMLNSVAAALPQVKPLIPQILDDKTSRAAIDHLPMPEEYRLALNAQLRNTATPTILSAGSKINVIPSVAEAQVDGRSLPGFDGQGFLAEVRPIVGDEVGLELLDDSPPLEADLDSPLYHTIVGVMQTQLPGAYPLPSLVTGATDAKHVTRLGTRVYGFSAMRYEPKVPTMPLVHGHDERISVDNLFFMTQTEYEIVTRFAGQGAIA